MKRALSYGGRLWRTLRPLRREQIVGRVVHEVRLEAFRRLRPLLPMLLGNPGPVPQALTLGAPGANAQRRQVAIEALESGRARFAGHDVSVRDWTRGDLPKLARYHLHYLEMARTWMEEAARDPKLRSSLEREALALIADWRDAHPPAGTEGWEPYPVSSRLQTLCVVAGLLGASAPSWLRRLIVLHARYVAAWPEIHLQGNHLLKNYCALALSGLLLQGLEARRWAEAGIEAIRSQLDEQLLEDGGHFERSPMYHLLAMQDLLDVLEFMKARASRDGELMLRHARWLERQLERMARFASVIVHPDGDIPLFNDSVLDQAPKPGELFARLGYSRGLVSERLVDLAQTGLVVIRPCADEVLVFDSGPLGPEHQPGHAHSDTFSFELSLGGERRIVDGGMDGYQSTNRSFFRSASAHNTVTVNGEGPDELWSSFRVGARSRVTSRSAEEREGLWQLEGTLVAFQGWAQRRRVALLPGRGLVVVDWIDAPRSGEVCSRVRLAAGGTPLQFLPLVGSHRQGSSLYAPRFGSPQEVAEHEMTSSGSQVLLAYALLWGSTTASARVEGGKVEVTIDGQSVCFQ